MKNNDYWFIKKNYERYILVFLWIVSILIGSYFYFLLYRQYSSLKSELKTMVKTHVHMWYMDESCSDQLKTSDTLRIKLK